MHRGAGGDHPQSRRTRILIPIPHMNGRIQELGLVNRLTLVSKYINPRLHLVDPQLCLAKRENQTHSRGPIHRDIETIKSG